MKTKLVSLITLISFGSFISGYILNKQPLSSNKNLSEPKRLITKGRLTAKDYTQVNCPNNPISIATFGQSNHANSMTERTKIDIPGNLYQYDWKSQKCYKYQEPLLGTNGRRGNAITHTSVKLSKTLKRPVVIIPFGVGGTSVLEWAYGDLSELHDLVMERIKNSGLSPQIFLWHQGESDSESKSSISEILSTPYFKSPKRSRPGRNFYEYYNALEKIVVNTHSKFPNTLFGIAIATRCRLREPWQPVRSAQLQITQNLPNTFISADSDAISGPENRPDECHFSPQGASLLSDLYYPSIMESLKEKNQLEATQ